MDELTFDELAKRYCEKQVQTPAGLLRILQRQDFLMKPDGWVLLECQLMDSSSFGRLNILPIGPNNTTKEIPTTPIALDGLASRTAVVVGWMPRANLPIGGLAK